MHFRITKDNLISEFHIEKWDSNSLGQEIIEEIQKYKNRNYEEFILFALKNKLFLKLRMLFLLGKPESIYFWSCAPIYGEDEKSGIKLLLNLDPERNISFKYAKFYLRGSESIQPRLVSVLYEAGLRQLLEEATYGPRDFIFELDEDEIKEISFNFNISRNNTNGIYTLAGKKSNNEQLMSIISRETMFTCLTEKTNELEILTEDFVKTLSSTDVKRYLAFLPTYTDDKDVQKELIDILTTLRK